MSEINKLTKKLVEFRDERDWKKFHNPKDLAIAINIESSELLENFLWKSSKEADLEKVKEELADIFCYALLLAESYELNVGKIITDKITKNNQKYPIEKAKGSNKKYNQL
jgi:NTP pyrophosphatase (non-canonical NTP hydrolase)